MRELVFVAGVVENCNLVGIEWDKQGKASEATRIRSFQGLNFALDKRMACTLISLG